MLEEALRNFVLSELLAWRDVCNGNFEYSHGKGHVCVLINLAGDLICKDTVLAY